MRVFLHTPTYLPGLLEHQPGADRSPAEKAPGASATEQMGL
jgi:hypothetical protein